MTEEIPIEQAPVVPLSDAPESLRQMMARNPAAYEFSDIQPDPADIGEIADLETMLGEHTQIRGRFYSRPVKAKHQKKLMRLARDLQAAGGGLDAVENIDAVTEALCQVLCIEQGEQYIDCSPDDIDEAFTVLEQVNILSGVFGVTQTEGSSGGPK